MIMVYRRPHIVQDLHGKVSLAVLLALRDALPTSYRSLKLPGHLPLKDHWPSLR